MNIFDIIALVIFFGTVLVCTLRGFLKIVARIGAFFAAMILAKWFGGMVGNMIFGDSIGRFAAVLGVAILFIVLSIVLKILFSLLAKIITKALHAKTVDKVLGALVGVVGGFASVYFFAWAVQLLVAVVALFNGASAIIALADSTYILKFFM